eukprot:650177-Pelagomonas_calceolata.AAC.3
MQYVALYSKGRSYRNKIGARLAPPEPKKFMASGAQHVKVKDRDIVFYLEMHTSSEPETSYRIRHLECEGLRP